MILFSLEIDSIVNANKADLGEPGTEAAPRLEQGPVDLMGIFTPLFYVIRA